MSARQISARILLQVGSELRVRNTCDLRVTNPVLEIMRNERGQSLDREEPADAAFDYRFDPETAEHVIRLLAPREINRERDDIARKGRAIGRLSGY